MLTSPQLRMVMHHMDGEKDRLKVDLKRMRAQLRRLDAVGGQGGQGGGSLAAVASRGRMPSRAARAQVAVLSDASLSELRRQQASLMRQQRQITRSVRMMEASPLFRKVAAPGPGQGADQARGRPRGRPRL